MTSSPVRWRWEELVIDALLVACIGLLLAIGGVL